MTGTNGQSGPPGGGLNKDFAFEFTVVTGIKRESPPTGDNAPVGSSPFSKTQDMEWDSPQSANRVPVFSASSQALGMNQELNLSRVSTLVEGQPLAGDGKLGLGPTGATSTYENTQKILPASYWANAPVEKPTEEFDQDFMSMSISSSILAYRTFNGRTYHAERGNAGYWAANDAQQCDSMDIFSHLCYLLNGRKAFRAPLDPSTLRSALDIGTGLGVWAIDFADAFPDCEVIGTDISPIQPSWVPENLRFAIEDCTQEWSFPSASMDYVHMRLLYGSIPDWEHLFGEAYRVAKPGAYIESFEASPEAYCDDGSVLPDSAIAQWGKFYMDGGRKNGRTFRILHDDIQIRCMQRLGMEDIHVYDMKCPCGAWPKDPDMLEIGYCTQATLEADYEGYLGLMAQLSAGWTMEETAVYCAHLRAEFRNKKNHAYFKFRCVVGRKPLHAT